MIKNGTGGANTQVGLHFESRVDVKILLNATPGYEVKKIKGQAGEVVYFEGNTVARTFKQHSLYKYLDEMNVEWKSRVSKKLLPDQALLLIVRETLYIIEIKFQSKAGSVDEKLQTCDFKRKYYAKLVQPLDLKVEYVYVLNDWFRNLKYKDTLDYVNSMNCHYRFNAIPLEWFGLPSVKL